MGNEINKINVVRGKIWDQLNVINLSYTKIMVTGIVVRVQSAMKIFLRNSEIISTKF